MKKHNVLFDLATVFFGYSGIPQDTRMMFFALCQANNVDLTGLVSGISSQMSHCPLKNPAHDSMKAIENFARFVLALKLEPLPIVSKYKILRLLKRIRFKLYSALSYLKKNYGLYPYHEQFLDFLWKTGFDGAVPREYRDILFKQTLTASNFSKHYLKASLLAPFQTPKLNTQGYDFAIFQDGTPNCPLVSEGTIPIVRYYDAVPLVCPDTIANPEMGPKLHAAGIKSAKKQGAYFACDSYPAEMELLKIAPELEGRTFVVPVSVIANAQIIHSDQDLVDKIIAEHACPRPSSPPSKMDNYIMSVSTLEPRKNFITLIQAFEKIILTKDPTLKLVIVGSPGWKCEKIMEAMNPLIEAGRLFHLQKVPTWELNVLYRHARAFVFPSYYEGFGITPVEASLAGCPTIVSDIPVHRWVMAEGALYCDPYNLFSISDAIEQLLYSDSHVTLRKHLKEKALMNAQRFTPAEIAKCWMATFDRLAQ